MKFRAPLGREVMAISVVGLLVIGVPTVRLLSQGVWIVGTLLLGILVAIVSLCVRGYELEPGELRVRRLFAATRVPLAAPVRAIIRPYAMEGSWRTWGNGGLLAITGHFSGSGLGRYRAYVTDPARTVVLETAHGIVVVSPDDPQAFVAAIARTEHSEVGSLQVGGHGSRVTG